MIREAPIPLLDPPTVLGKRPYARFIARVVKVESGCWEWMSARQYKGYGVFCGANDKRINAHRASWMLHYGRIPEGICVLHRCDNRCCVNPIHIFLGTNDDNIRDKVAKGRTSCLVRERNPMWMNTECSAKGEDVGTSKLRTADVMEIRRLYSQGKFQTALAKEFGVSQAMISSIILRKNWKHISEPQDVMPYMTKLQPDLFETHAEGD